MRIRAIAEAKKLNPPPLFIGCEARTGEPQITIRQKWPANAHMHDGTLGAPPPPPPRQTEKRHAESRIVLCGKYSSTLRKVRWRTAHDVAGHKAGSAPNGKSLQLQDSSVEGTTSNVKQETFPIFPLLPRSLVREPCRLL